MNNFPSKKLGEIVLHIQNGTTKKQVKEVTSLPVTRIETIADSSIDISKLGYLSMGESLNSIEKYILKPGDILFSHINSLEHLGKTAIYDAHPKLLIHGMNLLLIRAKNTVCDPHFLNFTFKFLRKNGIFKAIAGRAIGQASINQGNIKNVYIPCPKLLEQKAIANVLSTIQDAIEIRKKELKLQRELKEALMAHLFTYGTKNEPLKETEIGLIPQKWKIARLDEISFLKRGKFSHRPRNDPKYYGGNIPFIQTGDVTTSNGFIDSYSQALNDLGLSVSKIFPKGTIVITIAANIGYTAILGIDAAFPDSLVGISPKTEKCDSKYLHYYLTSVQKNMDEKAPRGTQKNINIQFLSPWPIPLPDLQEQKLIANVLETIDAKIDLISKETRLYEELFQAMLEELMTGKISTSPLIENCEEAS